MLAARPTGALEVATSYPAIVGAVLVGLRERSGLTQADLASRMGLAPSTWSRIENGTSALSIDQVARVAQELGVRPGDILKHADRAQDAVRERMVRVEPGRISPDSALALGIAVLGGAALGALIGVAISRASDDDEGDDDEGDDDSHVGRARRRRA